MPTWGPSEPSSSQTGCTCGSGAGSDKGDLADVGPHLHAVELDLGGRLVGPPPRLAQIGAGPQSAAIAMLERARGLRAVDPNFRRGLWGSDRRVELVLPLIERCDLVLAGDEELIEIFGEAEPEELARRCAQRGPSEVVVRGDHQVGTFRKDIGWTELKIQTEKTPDPMGAGDAFNAGCD
jgi:sugar/nucleoside kinase (ribokinase family)